PIYGALARLLRLGRQRPRGGRLGRRRRRVRLGVASHIRATEQQFLQGNLIGLGQRRLVRRRQGVAEFGKDLLIGRGGRLAGQDRDRRGRRRAIRGRRALAHLTIDSGKPALARFFRRALRVLPRPR